MNFLNFGYYIVEPVSVPKYLNLKCKQILTTTDCICNIHPSLLGSFWVNHERQQPEYKKSLGLSDEKFGELKETVSQLYYKHELCVDGRFAKLSDALWFCDKYLYNLSDIKVISISLEGIFKNAFIEDVGENLNMCLLTKQEFNGDFLGYDILGWDWSGFHSYLCNGLHKDISNKYNLEINDFGLIQNPYSQVKEFAEYIEDKGEPVNWLPFAIYAHTPK